MSTGFSITRTTHKGALPTLPFEQIKNDILGAQYVVSLVFVGEKRARTLNTQYRNKTYVPNVLSFPIDKKVGEIFITPTIAAKEAQNFGLSERGYIGYLFIHGLLHLKGLDHGATMDKAEARYMKAYHLT